MFSHRLLKMRCAVRYIISVFIAILVLISLHMSLFSDRTINLFKFQRDSQNMIFSNGILKLKRNSKGNFSDHILQPWPSNSVNAFKNSIVASIRLKNSSIAKSWAKYRNNPNFKTGNPLIDDYGKNDPTKTGENGRGVTFVGEEKKKSDELMKKYNLNVFASDVIPLNRKVPDSRFKGCRTQTYPKHLPSVSVIIPFYDEWPSILLRTVYSIINRSPRENLEEIILVDDASSMSELKDGLDDYIRRKFPKGLVKMIRIKERAGLINARLTGWRNSTGEVIIFLDSHMEVNTNWLPPLLTEIQRDRKTIAMGVLDYIQSNTLEYKFYDDYMTRYGFDWRLVFFETFFRRDQIGERPEDTRPGTVMVGAAFAIDSQYFKEMGSYDEGMSIWGGENLEMAWRIWLCGGRLVHVPCSHLGHVARGQPYSFPGGREKVELFNYKRAIEVWMEPKYKSLIYTYFPHMKEIDAGNLTDRLELKRRLQCKPFSWFLKNIWPELFMYNENVIAWGSARNLHTNKCLDNHQYLFQAAEKLYAEVCHYSLPTQIHVQQEWVGKPSETDSIKSQISSKTSRGKKGFSLTDEKLLRTSLQCVVVKGSQPGVRPLLEDCIIGPRDTWVHKRGGYIKHEMSGLCLDLDEEGPVMQACADGAITQIWQFNTYTGDETVGLTTAR